MLLDTKIENRGTIAPAQPPQIEATDLRVLLLAFDCHPTLPIIAYKTCRELARYTEATVVTRTYSEHVTIEGATTDILNIDRIKEPLDNFGELLRGEKNMGWTTKTALTYPSYLAFERMVWKKYGPLIRHGAFDLIARISPMSPTLPSPIAKWAPIPVVIGPINGGLGFPDFSEGAIAKEREWLLPLRNVINHLPYYRSSYKHADAVLAGFHHTMETLPAGLEGKLINFPEIGYDPELFFPSTEIPNPRKMEFVFVGRLVPNKRPDIAVQAFADSPVLQRHHLTIVGDGPERPLLEKMINQHGLHHCVDLVGEKDQASIGSILRRSHFFVFPSIRELGAGVIIEAMACGLPCVAIDFGATADLIADGRGIKVPVGNQESMQKSYQHAMEELVRSADTLPYMREQVIDYAKDYSWNAKVANLLEVFKWVAGKRDQKPVCYPF